jgi:hypothetical protein
VDEESTRGKRREEKSLKKRRKMKQHGKGMAQIYRNAVLKRIRDKESEQGGSNE